MKTTTKEAPYHKNMLVLTMTASTELFAFMLLCSCCSLCHVFSSPEGASSSEEQMKEPLRSYTQVIGLRGTFSVPNHIVAHVIQCDFL